MTRGIFIVAAIGAGLVLAGCSGGGGSGGGGGGAPDSYGDYVRANIDLRRLAEAAPALQPDALPVTGEAAYAGYAGFQIGVTPASAIGYFGAIDLTVGFDGAGTVNGRIHDIISNGNQFTGEDAGPVAGSLTIGNGAVDRVLPDPRFNPYILADVDGTLTHGDITQVVEGRLQGRLRGADGGFLTGDLNTRDPEPFDPLLQGSFTAAAD